IKQPPATGSKWRVHVPLHHAKQHVYLFCPHLPHKRDRKFHELRSIVAPKITHRHPPRLANGRSPSRHRNILKVSRTLEIGVVTKQHFPTPDFAVGSEPRAVQRQADDSAIKVVLDRKSTRLNSSHLV